MDLKDAATVARAIRTKHNLESEAMLDVVKALRWASDFGTRWAFKAHGNTIQEPKGDSPDEFVERKLTCPPTTSPKT